MDQIKYSEVPFHELIKAYRQTKGWSQIKLAKLAGIEPKTMRSMESASSFVRTRRETVIAVLTALDLKDDKEAWDAALAAHFWRNYTTEMPQRYIQRMERLLDFFGELAAKPVLAVPTFGISNVTFNRFDGAAQNQTLDKINLTKVVSQHDLSAANYVSRIFRNTFVWPELKSDIELDDKVDETAACWFGLLSGIFTFTYLDRTGGKSLFDIRAGERTFQVLINDKAKQVEGNEQFSIYLRQNQSHYQRGAEGQALGLILRYSPKRKSHPHRHHFLIGGLGWEGTVGAGWYLSSHWEKLSQRLADSTTNKDESLDFVALLECGMRPETSKIKELHVYEPASELRALPELRALSIEGLDNTDD